MDRNGTKRTILLKALDLFSVHGYDGVSVKDIASAVGIKDSSLYKHYRSKQEIFDSLLEEMDRHFGETVKLYRIPEGEIPGVAQQYMESDLAYLQKVSRWNFLFFFQDPFASRYRRLLNIEQYRNERAAATFRSFFMDTPLRFQTALFTEMIQRGFMREGDPAVMALQFYAPFWYLLDRYDGAQDREGEAVAQLDRHVEKFWHEHLAGKGASQ